MIASNLREFGESLVWTMIDTNEDVEQIFVMVRALIEDDMFSLVTLGGATKSLEKITVFDRSKTKLFSLAFEQRVVSYP